MKKKLLFAAALVIIACTFTSCTKTCKTCKQVTYDSGGSVQSQTDGQEYCGAELATIEITKDVTINGVTTKWECN